MSKILIEGKKVIIDGHASDLDTCNTLTNLCDELSKSDKFRTVKYESGYGEFESISENEDKNFPPALVLISILSNDGTELLHPLNVSPGSTITVTSIGLSVSDNSDMYSYTGNQTFLGLSTEANSTSATLPIGSTFLCTDVPPTLYIVEGSPIFQVDIKTNDGTAILAQNATVDSVVVTSTGARLKYGDTVNATYTYAGSKLFAGLATSANATAPKYKPEDTIEITAATTLYIVENIILPEHHSSLNELFTNIAAVIREKTGDTASIVADDFPDVIRERLQVIPQVTLISFTIAGTSYQAEEGMTWEQWVNSDYNTIGATIQNNLVVNSKGNAALDTVSSSSQTINAYEAYSWGPYMPV